MQARPTAIPEIVLLEPQVHADGRGFFFESWNARSFREATGLDVGFVQDNHSRSAGGVLRGLHYQLAPHAQGKLVRAIVGSIFDVAVDLRRSSPTFGRWVAATLSAENRHQLWIPRGFAHGFLALRGGAEVVYKTTEFFAPGCDRSIAWNDPQLAIDWPLEAPPVLSQKDAAAPSLDSAELFE